MTPAGSADELAARAHALAYGLAIRDRVELRRILAVLQARAASADQLREALDTLLFWTEAHLNALRDLDDQDEDDAEVLSSLRHIVTGERGCTTEEDYTPDQWRALQVIASRRAALSAGSGTPGDADG